MPRKKKETTKPAVVTETVEGGAAQAAAEFAEVQELLAEVDPAYKPKASKPKTQNPDKRTQAVVDFITRYGGVVNITGSGVAEVRGSNVFDINLGENDEFIKLTLSQMGFTQIGELEEALAEL